MFKLFITSFFVFISVVSFSQNKSTTTGKTSTTTTKTTSEKKPVTKGTATGSSQKKTTSKGKVNFKITGKIVGFKNHLIVMNKFRSTEFLLLDSMTTDAEGNFTFSKTLSEPCIVYLQHIKNAAVPLIIEDGAVFNVIITPVANSMDYKVSGIKAEKSIRLYNFIKKHSEISAELSAVDEKLQTVEDPALMQEYQLGYSNRHNELVALTENEMVASGLEGYFVLFNFMEEQKATDIKKIMDVMTPLEKSTSYYKDLKTIYETSKFLDIGEIAPDFSLPTPNGDMMKLSDLRGKIVLIDFWASWCGPCRSEFPDVKRVYNKFGEMGFEILGVSLDKEETAWKNSIISLGLNWKHVSDLKYWNCAPARLYKISSIPATILLDKDGRIIAKNLRGLELERKLEEIFQ